MRYAFAALFAILASPSLAAECLLEVEGTKYIDGPCEFEAIDGLDFRFGVYPDAGASPMRFAYVYVEGDTATGFWNGEPAESHAHEQLGDMERSGECWVGASAKVCVSP